MRCPKCEIIDLVMSDRAGIEIDYCPACRGVWLDRGELDKIIERSMLVAPSMNEYSRHEKRSSGDDYKKDRKYSDDYRHKKRKKNLFEELFDF